MNGEHPTDGLLSFFSGLSYDGAGNRTHAFWDIPTVMSSGANYAAYLYGGINYSYDDKDRLTQEYDSRAATNGGGFDYYFVGANGGNARLNANDPAHPDQNNFVTDLADNLTTIRSSAQTYNDNNQTSMAGFSYDLDGSPTSYLQRSSTGTFNPVTLTFDQESRATNFASFTAKYYPDGMRASKTSGGSTFYYLYDGSTVLCEINGSGNATNVFAYGAYGLAERYEAQNLVTHAFTYDPSGNVVQRHSVKSGFPAADFTTVYDGYGQQLGCISPNSGAQYLNATQKRVSARGSSGEGCSLCCT